MKKIQGWGTTDPHKLCIPTIDCSAIHTTLGVESIDVGGYEIMRLLLNEELTID